MKLDFLIKLLKIVVRSRKDADAVTAMLRRFYSDWGIEVITLKGIRGDEAVTSGLRSLINSNSIYIVLLGRDDVSNVLYIEESLPPNVVVCRIPKTKVRNARIEELAREFNTARVIMRLRTRWSREHNAYVFSGRGEALKNFLYEPLRDAFLGLGAWGELVGEVTGLGTLENPLIVRCAGGEHIVYCGPEPCGAFKILNEGLEVKGYKTSEPRYQVIKIENLLKANDDVLKVYEGISTELLRRFKEWADHVVVPWSGGKDSTAVLLLALKVFPRSKIIAVYSDTGVEFPQTVEYIEEVSRKLGVEVVRLPAGVDRGILEEGLPLPSHSNRWCTLRKVSVIEKFLKELDGNVLVVVGDRDAESESRFRRPPVRWVSKSRIEVAPIKFWGTALTQLYIQWNNLRLNPLYLLGFYRIGCYICPALRSWELRILTKNTELLNALEGSKLFKLFISSRLGKSVRSYW